MVKGLPPADKLLSGEEVGFEFAPAGPCAVGVFCSLVCSIISSSSFHPSTLEWAPRFPTAEVCLSAKQILEHAKGFCIFFSIKNCFGCIKMELTVENGTLKTPYKFISLMACLLAFLCSSSAHRSKYRFLCNCADDLFISSIQSTLAHVSVAFMFTFKG